MKNKAESERSFTGSLLFLFFADIPKLLVDSSDMYTGRIVAVGISYQKESKEHRCKVETL